MTRGKFITFEGGDGAGKSTQIDLLARHLEAKGRTVMKTREPGGTPASEAIRKVLKDPNRGFDLQARTELLLFQAARAEFTATVVRPALERGEDVVCDRYFDSTIAYQGHGLQIPLRTIYGLNTFTTGNLWPDVTILIDTDPQEGLARSDRTEHGGTPDVIESRDKDFHGRVADGFKSVAKRYSDRVVIVPFLDKQVEEMHRRIAGHVDALFEVPVPNFYAYFLVAVSDNSHREEMLPVYRTIVSTVKGHGGRVLTKHLVRDDLHAFEAANRRAGVNIHNRDEAWLDRADIGFAEVTYASSFGVGLEAGYLLSQGKPLVCLFDMQRVESRKLTSMIRQNPHLTLVSYKRGDGTDYSDLRTAVLAGLQDHGF